ncbi:Transcriptional regulatory protein UhpA [Corynebacterium ciconiae DSM 44920]|uniref:response regulator transcription factor n=1 Tax=Corynebacterium ciconiae TaxID=227319 RepID=UPI0003615842|nr:response regulator transcription factor [Corynebacterium ciconiae]WKD60141.1 Transcriptional regulatory protein UhpA [Corynebacterium ciconiae DSM 44920]
MIRVLLADDQALVRGALAALLDLERDIEVVAQCGSGSEVVPLIDAHSVDIALVDIEMPDMSGLEAAKAITERNRHAATPCACVIVTTFGRAGYVKTALAHGARGFLVKDTPPEQLAEAVRQVHHGLTVIDPEMMADTLSAMESPLTPREVEVARQALSGADTRSIAAALHMSAGTVRNHLSSIIAKTNAGNRYEAARMARDAGWL